MQIFSPADSATYAGFVLVRKNINDAGWTAWYHFATTTTPQQFDLPLADGLIQSSASWYSKDQFGQVHVHGAIYAGSGSFERDMIVATLPEGYRPSERIEAMATFFLVSQAELEP